MILGYLSKIRSSNVVTSKSPMRWIAVVWLTGRLGEYGFEQIRGL